MSENQSGFLIREINPQTDLGAIADLIKNSFRKYIDPDGQQFIDQLIEMDKKLRSGLWGVFSPSPDFKLNGYVAVDCSRKIVGTAHLFPCYPPEGKGYLIANVCVDQNVRNHGIAGNLLRHCEQFALTRSVRRLYLQARVETPNAIRFYQQRGFGQDAFRTSWIRPKGIKPTAKKSILTIGRGKWRERALLEKKFEFYYPKKLLWNLNYPPNLLSLNPLNQLIALINQHSITLHRVSDSLGRPVSWIIRQQTDSFADMLWFIPNETAFEEELMESLSLVAGRYRYGKPLLANAPNNDFAEIFSQAGFYRHNRLIWMSKTL